MGNIISMGKSDSKVDQPNLAIEIGSVNSGYAYLLRGKSLEMFTATYDYGLPENRVPTALLLNSDGALDSFGTVAKDKFYALALKDEQHTFKYFDKVLIEPAFCESSLAPYSADATNEDSVSREEIFAKIIKFLYEKSSNKVKRDGQSKPLLVFTVSGTDIKTESKFIRSAATKSGITEEEIIVLPEIDAAAFYCTRQFLVANQSTGTNRLPKGSRFIVVNLGGNKTQFCAFEVKENDFVEPLSDVESLPFGGETVTESFLRKIESMVGKEKWNSFKDTNLYSYIDIKRSFENCKRTFDSSTQGFVIEMPQAFMKMVDSKTVQQSINGFFFAEDNKIIIERKTLKSVFDESLQEIVNKLRDTRKTTPDFRDTDVILLVGGFAKSSYAREFITNEMKTNPVVLVPNPDLAVLNGAAMLKKPCLRSPCAYGLIRAKTSNPENSQERKLYKYENIISKNEIVYSHQVFKKIFKLRGKETNINIALYQTDIKHKNYSTEDIEELNKTFKQVKQVEGVGAPVNGLSDITVELLVTVVENRFEFNLYSKHTKKKN